MTASERWLLALDVEHVDDIEFSDTLDHCPRVASGGGDPNPSNSFGLERVKLSSRLQQ